MKELVEFRCGYCNKLLAKYKDGSTVEVKCPKCKSMNKIKPGFDLNYK